jgi:hypothetical protein
MASITLPRPRRKGNLANVAAPIPVNKNRANGCRTRREKEKGEKNEGEYRGTYLQDWNSAVLAYRLYGGLSGNKRNFTTETLQLPSK